MQEQVEVNEVLELRPNNKQLKGYIHMKYKKAATLKDIQNVKLLLRKAKASGRKAEQILLDTLKDALTQDSNAKGGIIVDENDEVAKILCHFSLKKCPSCLKNFQRYIVGRWYVQCKQSKNASILLHGRGNGRNVRYLATAEEGSVNSYRIVANFMQVSVSLLKIQHFK